MWHLILAALGLTAAACGSEDRGYLFGGVEGRAVFLGPVVGAPVTLVRLEGGEAVETMATATTDAAGRFEFRPLVADNGVYRVQVDLSGLRWSSGDRSGQHPAGLTLTATLTDYGRYTDRSLSVSAYTTLADAVAEALRGGQTDPDERARAGWVAHLDLDPAQSEIGDPLSDVAREPTRHRLLVDAFDVLPAQLATAAGLDPQTVDSGRLLLALVDDALGLSPAGRFDGQGVAGPAYLEAGITPLDPDALRHHLAASVRALVERDPNWSQVPAAAVAAIVRRLSCSPSSLFPACDPSSITDATPPVIDAIDPAPGTALGGVVDVTVRAHEPDGTLARVDLVLRFGDRRTPVPVLPGPGYTFRLDTGNYLGVAQLDADIIAVNGAGLETRRAVSWPLRDREAGSLSGVVHKGPAHRARVRAYDLTSPPLLLGQAVTDDTGAFSVPIIGFVGPVRLEVSDDATAAPGAPSVYLDEVRGVRRWRTGRTLEALVPEFRTGEAQEAPVVITPFTDIALARARRAQADGELLVASYEAALTALADQLGLPATPEALLHTLPAPFDQSALAFEASEKLSFALGCFSAQADTLAQTALPDQPDAFDALDLVALYRLDLVSDPHLDGLTRDLPAAVDLPEGQVELPPDPLRADFVTACGRWLNHPANQMALSTPVVVRHLQRMAGFTAPVLYDPELRPRPFDEAPPQLVLQVEVPAPAQGAAHAADFPTPETADAPEFDATKLTVVRGTIDLVIEATDPSGIATLTAQIEGLPGEPPVEITTEALSPFAQRLRLRLNSDALAERRHIVRVEVADHLDSRQTSRHVFAVDRTPPEVTFTGDDLNFIADQVYTRRANETPTRTTWSDASPTEATVRFNGLDLVSAQGRGGESELPADLPLHITEEGIFPLEITVTDQVGLSTRLSYTLNLDRQAPRFVLVRSTYHDELFVPATRELRIATDQVLDAAGGLVRRWQTTWTAESDNPSEIRFSATEPEVPGQSPPALLHLDAELCLLTDLGICDPTSVRRLTLTGDDPKLQITAGPEGLLAFDPIAAPPPPGRFRIVYHTLTDAAGNQVLINRTVDYQHQVVAPPVIAEVLNTLPPEETPPNVVVMERLDIAGGDLTQLLARPDRSLLLHGLIVDNPHPIPVVVQINLPTRYRFTTSVGDAFVRRGLAERFVPPHCGDGTIDPTPGTPRRDRPIEPASCSEEPVPTCSRCLAAPGGSLLAGIDVLVPPESMSLVVLEGIPRNVQREDGGTVWSIEVPAGVTLALGLLLRPEAALASIAHYSDTRDALGEVAEGGGSSFAVYQSALRFYADRQIVSERYIFGEVHVRVDLVTMAPEVAVDGHVGAILHGVSTGRVAVRRRPSETRRR